MPEGGWRKAPALLCLDFSQALTMPLHGRNFGTGFSFVAAVHDNAVCSLRYGDNSAGSKAKCAYQRDDAGPRDSQWIAALAHVPMQKCARDFLRLSLSCLSNT